MEAEVKPTAADVRRRLMSSGEYVKFSQTFSSSSTRDEELAALALKYLTDFDLLPFTKDDDLRPGKSLEVSADLWNAGNGVFLRDNMEAVGLYSRSIAAAPHHEDNSEQLALGFANRSALYYVMGKYEACLRDIQQALTYNYPEKLKRKLIQRRVLCYQKMEKTDGDWKSENTNCRSPTSALPDDGQLLITDTLNPFHSESETVYCRRPSRVSSEPEHPLPQISYGKHRDIQSASSCLDIGYTSTLGRFFVANRDIDPGSILIVEEPICSVLLSDHYLTHCSECLRRCDAMVPCKTCQSVMYCSSWCRDAAWVTSHHIECWLLPAFRRLDVSQTTVFLLPLRMLLLACRANGGLPGFYRQVRAQEARGAAKKASDPKDTSTYLSLGYTHANYLCHHRTKDPDFQLAWAVGVGCILNLLDTQSDFFSQAGDCPADLDQTTLKLFAGGMLLKYIGITITNCFSVTEFVVKAGEKQVDEAAFGDAIYSTMSLLNHSCNPNALNSFHHGDVNVLMAKQLIKKGEQVCISYGGSFAHRELSERQHELRMNYHFKCVCEACARSWPMFSELRPLHSPTFVCERCRAPLPERTLNGRNSLVTCVRCKRRHNLYEMREHVRGVQRRIFEIYSELKAGSTDNFIGESAEIVKMIDGMVVSPCQLSVAAQQYLRYSLKATGNHVIL